MKKIILFLTISLSLLSCGSEEKESSQTESQTSEVTDKSTPVKVMRLDYSNYTHDLIANGTVTSQQKAELHFKSTEVISAIYVKNGDKVRKGEKIAELDRFRLQNSLLQAKDNFDRAKLELQDVLIGLGYLLSDSASIPAEVMVLAKIRSNYDQTLLGYRLAEENLKEAVLTAPFSGVVANLFKKTHNYTDSEPFCTIIDNQHMEVDFNVLEVELPFVAQGGKVRISPYSIDQLSVEGKISTINPIVDTNGMVRVKAALQANSKLYEGMNVRVLIQQQLERQLIIPKEALVLRSNRKVVFTLKNNQATWVYVETGLENSYGYVITDNSLQPGDTIIYDGNINLAHESRVQVMSE